MGDLKATAVRSGTIADAEYIASWDEFEAAVRRLRANRAEVLEADPYAYVTPLLFRGHANAIWKLETTLERQFPQVDNWLDYFRVTENVRDQIESLSGKRWDVPDFGTLAKWTENNREQWLSSMPGYGYQVYLRHHGFPSPLLDWTRSPYVAAFFAFQNATDYDVAIFALLEQPGNGKSSLGSQPVIHSQGPNVSSHARHVLQQCEYTICTTRDRADHSPLKIANHEDVFGRRDEMQDLLWKFVLPGRLRTEVLRRLDEFNLNAFSLFQSEEALLSTVALREIQFSGRYDRIPKKIAEPGSAVENKD